MRFAITVLFAASLASAYTIKRQDAPTGCAQNCFEGATPGFCAGTDLACLCVNRVFWNSFATCVQTSCTAEEVAAATENGKALCKNAGVDVDNPVPTCAVTCDQNSTSTPTCAADDIACFCNDTTYVQTLAQCTNTACTGGEYQTAAAVFRAECRAYGVDISASFP